MNELVDRAYNGADAVNLVIEACQKKTHIYGLIFMDLSMPFMDGFECSKTIRNYYNLQNIVQPLIIACTGHVEDDYINKAWSM